MNKTKTIRKVILLLILSLFVPVSGSAQRARQYKVAACDWMMLKRQKIGEFKLAREIGADGVEMDMGGLGRRDSFDNKLRHPHFQRLFRRTADSLAVEVPSVAMSGFFGQSILKKSTFPELVSDCLNTMQVMGSKVAFLPLGGTGDGWKQPGDDRRQLVRLLHNAGEEALKRGVVIGIRTGLDAKGDKKLLREIDSEGIKIYYNLQDAVDQGRDACKELKTLGRKRICQIHASLTDSVTLDRDNRIDMRAVRNTLDKMRWTGWLVVERSRDVSRVRDVKHNYSTNVRFLKETFNK